MRIVARVVIVVLGFGACGGAPPPASQPTAPVANTAPPPPPPPAKRGDPRLPRTIESLADFRAASLAMIEVAKEMFDEQDCDTIAARITAYTEGNRDTIAAMSRWMKAHPAETKTVEDEIKDKAMEMVGPAMRAMSACKDNPALNAAMKKAEQLVK